jgi:heme A synthase
MTRFARYAWSLLAYNLLVILWGAYVRATGSGAGCGAHWPLCQGVVVPRAPQVETWIEFSHRLSSGLVLFLAIILGIWAFRIFPKGSYVRTGAVLTLVFTLTEALVGAGLVLFGLTAENDSVARAVSIAVHLVNTFLLLAALTLTAWWADRGDPAQLKWRPRSWLMVIAMVGVMFIGVSGAITALGDTLFPASSLSEGFSQDISASAHFLIRLRVYHPLVAVVVSGYILALIRWLQRDPHLPRKWIFRMSAGLIIVQLLAGAVNVVLLAPVWMQLIHLLLADSVWISLVLASELVFYG